ncbi:hypothetical protein OQA88_10297 [Cercophora sp. LCS_1]
MDKEEDTPIDWFYRQIFMPKWNPQMWRQPDVNTDDNNKATGVTKWKLRVPKGGDHFNAINTAMLLANQSTNGDSLTPPGMTRVADEAGAYPWVAHIFSRKLVEAKKGVREDKEAWKKYEWYIPTAWHKGTAFFVRDTNTDGKSVYLLTAAHNLISRVPKNHGSQGEHISNTGKGSAGPQEWPIDKDEEFYERRCLADSVSVVAWRPGTSPGDPRKRFYGWADRASLCRGYYEKHIGTLMVNVSQNYPNFDVAALRLRAADGFPTQHLGAMPYLVALPISTLRPASPGTPGSPVAVHYAAVGLHLAIDKTTTPPTVFSQALYSRNPGEDQNQRPRSIRDFPSVNVVFEPPSGGWRDPTVEEELGGLLTLASAHESLRGGYSGGLGLIGGKDDQDTYVAGCVVVEASGNAQWVQGVAMFTDDPTANEVTDPRALLAALGCKMKWEDIQFNGWQCKRLVRDAQTHVGD